MAKAEKIDRWFCACSSYPDDPGMVVCWRCEQPLAELPPSTQRVPTDAALVQNLLLVGIRNRRTLERIESEKTHVTTADGEHDEHVFDFRARAAAKEALDGS